MGVLERMSWSIFGSVLPKGARLGPTAVVVFVLWGLLTCMTSVAWAVPVDPKGVSQDRTDDCVVTSLTLHHPTRPDALVWRLDVRTLSGSLEEVAQGRSTFERLCLEPREHQLTVIDAEGGAERVRLTLTEAGETVDDHLVRVARSVSWIPGQASRSVWGRDVPVGVQVLAVPHSRPLAALVCSLLLLGVAYRESCGPRSWSVRAWGPVALATVVATAGLVAWSRVAGVHVAHDEVRDLAWALGFLHHGVLPEVGPRAIAWQSKVEP